MTRNLADHAVAELAPPAPEPTGSAAEPGKTRRRRRRPTGRLLVLYGALLPGGVVFASVFAYAVVSALKPADEVLASPLSWWPSHVTWSNFADPFRRLPFGRYYVNSVVVGIAV